MLAFIGGTGLTRMDNLRIIRRQAISTRFGDPSAAVVEGELDGQNVLFLARHGDPHVLLPHQVNYRANLVALKEAGATAIVAVNAVGGITAQAPTGALVLPDQIIDYTWGREMTLFDDPAEPFLSEEVSTEKDEIQRSVYSKPARLANQILSEFVESLEKSIVDALNASTDWKPEATEMYAIVSNRVIEFLHYNDWKLFLARDALTNYYDTHSLFSERDL